jgi:HSP20 family protein
MALTRLDRFGIEWPWRRWLDLGVEPEGWMRVEEFEDGGTLVIRAELPGVDPDKDVDIEVAEGMLHIAARREQREEHKEEGTYRSEFRYGELRRDLALPTGVDANAVKAEYKPDGILEVRIPWPAEPEPVTTRVPVARA